MFGLDSIATALVDMSTCRHADYSDFDPDHVAAIIAEEIGRPPSVRDVETNGAATAASLIAELR